MAAKTLRIAIRRKLLMPVLAMTVVAIGVGCASVPVDYSVPKALLEPHRTAVTEIVGLLDQGRGDDARSLLGELHDAVIEANALLVGTYFSGSADVLTDPFALAAGTYRVHLKTDGAPFVAIVPIAAPDRPSRIFSLISNDAVDGISKLYVANGDRIMLEFSFVDAPYELWFERIE